MGRSKIEAFIPTLSYFNTQGETGEWINWLEKSLPADKAEMRIGALMRNWAQADLQASGKWLAATPDGSTKSATIQMYAATVSKYEPEAPAQWAMTLRAGKDREWTLGQIYQNWPEEDPAAKEAFAKEHRISAASD